MRTPPSLGSEELMTHSLSARTWCFGGNRRRGGQLKTLRKSYLDLLRKLQFDTNKDTSDDDSALRGSHGTSRNILEVICNDSVEFNLRLAHGISQDVRE